VGGWTLNLRPDGFLGAVIASESIGTAKTVINGSGGCRSRSRTLIHDLIPGYAPGGECCMKGPTEDKKLPCTCLDAEDIIFGASPRIRDTVYPFIEQGEKVMVVDTLGASLTCDDWSNIQSEKDVIMVEGDLSGMSMSEGYDRTMCELIGDEPFDGGENGGVNLLGYGIMDIGWERGAEEMRHILDLMELETVCVPGCRPSKKDVARIGGASLNIMVHPEYSRRTAEMMRRDFGIPFLRPAMGAPVGYPATRSFIEDIARSTGRDPSKALDYVNKDAKDVYRVLSSHDSFPRWLFARGMTIKADSSVAYPLMDWMMSAFGMAPRKISALDEEYLPEIANRLKSEGYKDALIGTDGEVEVVFSDGLTTLEGRMSKTTAGYIETCMPRGSYMNLSGRTLIGTCGCRNILDDVFNSITRFKCGQPNDSSA